MAHFLFSCNLHHYTDVALVGRKCARLFFCFFKIVGDVFCICTRLNLTIQYLVGAVFQIAPDYFCIIKN